MKTYDLIIVGGGAAGFSAAMRAESLRARTLMVNSGLPLGGTCVNVGCVPSKHLLEVGHDLHLTRNPRFTSISPAAPRFDFLEAVKEKDLLVDSLRGSNYVDVVGTWEHVEYVEGHATFTSAEEVSVNGTTYSARRLILATGSTTKVPPIRGLSDVGYLTNETILSLKSLPKSLIVLGGGPLGLEFAQMFRRFGSEVTVLELMERVLPNEEPEMSVEIRRYLEEEGIGVFTGAKVRSVSARDGVEVVADLRSGEETFRAEHMLLATGVVARTEGLNLQKAGIVLDLRGFIQVDDALRTTNPRVFAAGDCTGNQLLETVAAKEGYVAAKNALEGTELKVDYTTVPRAVFTSPQVASVGLTESQLMERVGVCACRVVALDRLPKALAVKDTRGLLKMVVDPNTSKVVGVHMVGPHAAEVITAATYALRAGMTVDDIIDTVHVFPTYAEALKLAALAFRMRVDVMPCCIM
jgi:mercuric reductase